MLQNGNVPTGPRANDDYDAIVIGAGHNGLITAAYLARAGRSTLLIEARQEVGGTATSEMFSGATVNICNCDHLTFRTTPVMDELDLRSHGLAYHDVDPAMHMAAWSDGTLWTQYHDLDATLDELAAVLPDEVDGYRRYVATALPAARMVLEAAAAPPTIGGLTRRALASRFVGSSTLLRWSRRSAADVLRSYFRHDAITAGATVGGPMVWGISPEFKGSGLGALSMAMRHVGQVGRPVGGSGAMPRAVLAALEAAGGELLAGTRVTEILCEGDAVRGVRLEDGTLRTAPVVVSACDPHRTFLRWLTNAPSSATSMINRWKAMPQVDGYESKLDVIVNTPPILKALGEPTASTLSVAPSLANIDDGYRRMLAGEMLDEPALLVNTPTVLDPSMCASPTRSGMHVVSLEVLYTPYALRGGWERSTEPRRWLELFGELCEPGFVDSIVDYRAMTPDVYERDFHLPAGHATSFAGGPLAVFRQKHPELTKYQTAVGGLYITGAATFPGAGIWGASGRNCATVILESGV